MPRDYVEELKVIIASENDDDAKKSDSINITIEALGYAAPNSTSGQIVISQNPSYKVIVSSVASYKNGELVVDTDKMKVDSVLKLF